MTQDLWQQCLQVLKTQIPEPGFSMWIQPLQVIFQSDQEALILAPNELVLRGMQNEYYVYIQQTLEKIADHSMQLTFGVGSRRDYKTAALTEVKKTPPKKTARARTLLEERVTEKPIETSNLNPDFIFNNFVEGKSNQFALAACSQVSRNPGTSHNPLFIYGNTGLGKTHLMHAIGNSIKDTYPDARLIYQHCDSFIEDIVRTIRNNTLNELRHFYKSLDALLIDDIQLLSGKEVSQEVFFHTFNALLDGGNQVILTCDRYPKELESMEERLKSRFASGLIVNIDPPDFEHRVAILMKKAESWQLDLKEDTAFFIAETVKASVRELEGALKQVSVMASFKGQALTVEIAREALSHLCHLQSQQITLPNIQKVVTHYYGLKANDLLSKTRAANIARPRQVAMFIARELTRHSLPEIGRAFGRDHSTVMHACRKIQQDLELDVQLKRDFDAIKAALSV